jgi:ribosomal protein L37AE/L43A
LGVPDFYLHQWFNADELEPCPACNESAGVKLATSASFVCLSCGHATAGGTTQSSMSEQPESTTPTH